jgi:phosphoserine phosphatase
MTKAILLDFDGTMVTKDILDVVCGIVDKEAESKKLNEEFIHGHINGRQSLIDRINFIQGVNVKQIKDKLLDNNYLMPGARELISFLKEQGVVTILYSGNIEPILEFYKDLLDIDYIVGTKPKMKDGTIEGIGEEDFPNGYWKLVGIEKILKSHDIRPEETIAIDDSIAGKQIFEYSGKSIAINPKGGIERYATYTINGDLNSVVNILKNEISQGGIEGQKRKEDLS